MSNPFGYEPSALIPVVEIFRAFENMRDICNMLYGGTYFYILLIYYIYRAKNITNIKYKIFRISHSGP